MQEILYPTIGDVSTTKLQNKINEIENSYNTDQADFWEAFLRITVKSGLEKRRNSDAKKALCFFALFSAGAVL